MITCYTSSIYESFTRNNDISKKGDGWKWTWDAIQQLHLITIQSKGTMFHSACNDVLHFPIPQWTEYIP
jgi:hypothetical protein